jgi:MYXO-CTERM domain-containing protein
MNGVGQCSGAMCHTDADCRAPLPVCDLANGSADGRCVQCLFDTDCDAPLVCDPTKKKCLECIPGSANQTQCKPEMAGAQCLADGRCGCVADADCGGAQSGRVCDATASRCVPGCRGTGGNGCPSEQVCSSTTDEIGRCGAAPPGDGGVDGGTDGSTDGATPPSDGGAGDAREVGVADAGGDTGGGLDGPTADGSSQTDATPPDAGNPGDGGDGGTTPMGSDRFIAGGGCHCATAPAGGGSPWIAGLAALWAMAISVVRRRRRR